MSETSIHTETGVHPFDSDELNTIRGICDTEKLYPGRFNLAGYAAEVMPAMAEKIEQLRVSFDVREEKRVTYLIPGILFPEDDSRTIEDGPDLVDRAAAQAPRDAYCFTIETVLVADPIPDGRGGTLRVQPKSMDESGYYYLGGELFTAEQIEALDDSGREYQILLSNMRGNDWQMMIRTPLGNWQPFGEGDVLLPNPVRE